MLFEELDSPLMGTRFCPAGKGAQIATLSRFRVFFARIQAVSTRLQFADHSADLLSVLIKRYKDAGRLEPSWSGHRLDLPASGEEATSRGQPALLVFLVGGSRALSNLLVGFVGNPSIERALQGIGLGSHQAGFP